jgi:hypothetical protein
MSKIKITKDRHHNLLDIHFDRLSLFYTITNGKWIEKLNELP